MTKLESNNGNTIIDNVETFKENIFFNTKKDLDDLKTGVLIPESLIIDGSLDDQLFDDENEFLLFKNWICKNLYCKINLQNNDDWLLNKQNCITKIDEIGKLYKINFNMPKDFSCIKISDIPILVKQINYVSFGEKMPEYTSYKEISNYLLSLISFLQDSGKVDLVKYYQDFLKNFNSDFDGNIDEDLKLQFQIMYDLQDVEFDKKIESDLSFFLKKKLFESSFEGGMKLLYENMKAPKDDEYGTLLNGLEQYGVILNEAKTLGNSEKILEAEKILIEKIYEQIIQYPDFSADINYVFSTSVLESGEMLCLSKTILGKGLFDYFGIQNTIVVQDRHIFNTVILSNGEKYVVDLWKNKSYKREENKYEDVKYKTLYEGENLYDSENIFLSELLYYMFNYGDGYSYDLLALNLTTKINPDNIWARIDLGTYYKNTKGMEQNAYWQFKKAEEILKTKMIKNNINDRSFWDILTKKDIYKEDFDKIQLKIYQNLYSLNLEFNIEPKELNNQRKCIKNLTK